MLVLHHVARCGLVEVVGQGRCHRQVHERRVAYAVPALCHGDGAVLQALEGPSPDVYLMGVLHHHAVAMALRECNVLDVRACGADPLLALIDQREALGVLGEHVAFLPIKSAEHLREVLELGVIDVERHPVPAICEGNLLHIHVVGTKMNGIVDSAHDGLIAKVDGLR